ncbi:hypothetical protein AVEN_203451-1 [Araneus ventricosus]|uniref:Uncharacterized protein n=1 Tax=Araneus ventricosus TaxID=182803 RepID=A0A4Y2BIS5_ARAVE|nr:hypothetical protein AVEN_203451-1 [Araneus ventricosus]
MAQEEDRKAIGGELESEMVILSPATNGRCFSQITDLAACLGSVFSERQWCSAGKHTVISGGFLLGYCEQKRQGMLGIIVLNELMVVAYELWIHEGVV